MRMEADSAGAQGGERVVWEYHHVSLNRVPGYGFGIAVSGGRDNPHFTTGDPSIAISDVLKAGPAEGKLHVNDRVLSANGLSLENVDYATAVQVLKDSGAMVQLHVKRRVVLPASLEPQILRMTLTKGSRKEDFGFLLGWQPFVKEIVRRPSIVERDVTLHEGDVLVRINDQPTDSMTPKEVKKLVDAARERLSLTVRREPSAAGHHSKESSHAPNRPSYGASPNLYVQPPTRNERDHRPAGRHGADKNNLLRQNGRSRGPLMDISLSQLDQPATPLLHGHPGQGDPPPPRPPPPRDSVDGLMTNGLGGPQRSPGPGDTWHDMYGSRRQSSYDQQSPKSKGPEPDPRFISFQKEGSVGIRLTGGNKTGIYVIAVQADSPAAVQGLQPGDKILKVNGMEMKCVTREEAVLYLLSLQDQIDLIVQYKKAEFDQLVAAQQGDSFYIRTHFNYEQADKNELSFRKGDIFHVVDTLNNGVVGGWQVNRIGRNNEATQKGVIPNKARAEELATAQFNAAKKEHTFSETRSRLFSRKRRQRRSKSLGKDHWEDLVFDDSVSKFPAYERVVLRQAGFVRPVVLFGAVADLARQQLLRDLPDRLAAPQLDPGAESKAKSSGIIRLSAIRGLVERGRHALLDVTPNAVDRLNYAQLYPIVVFLRAESKHVIKEVRAAARATDKPQHKSSKKIYEQCVKLEKLWSHLFTATITLTDADSWYRKVKDLIEKQQSAPIWMSETKPGEAFSDDFLFPMTSRLSYASSPESEPEGGDPVRRETGSDPHLLRSSSDPSLAADDLPPPLAALGGPPPYTPHQEPPRAPGHRHSHGGDSRYGFSAGRYVSERPGGGDGPSPGIPRRLPAASPGSGRHSPYQTLPHEFRAGGQPSPARGVDREPPSAQHTPSRRHGSGQRGSLPEQAAGRAPPADGLAHQSHQRTSLQEHQVARALLPDSPPKVDRSSKPSAGVVGTRSYGRASGGQMRNYLQRDDGNYMNSGKNYTLDRLKSANYDSGSPYDSYQRFANMHDDLKASRSAGAGDHGSPGGYGGRPSDPYRLAPRGHTQPSYSAERELPHTGHGGRGDYRPMPPPKSGSNYKPIPPPKPKGGRGPPPSAGDPYWRGGPESAPRPPADSRAASREDFSYTNGEEPGGGFDSGHGSSLDRNYDPAGRTYINMKPASGGAGYYLNVPGAPREPPPTAGLDLCNRDQRGSAFELYRKPDNARYLSSDGAR
ncbi:tight junction protein ZO-1-like [Amphibalanus amphitrite]|uniref:tight junction protein ZO-1-like n=1 Tax=Amphibalanus amphitrite TaxID=1232801 RepID=UPI001C91EA76|nr:tight junction protein ZO-1-like [Amphibalanus amphitrite]